MKLIIVIEGNCKSCLYEVEEDIRNFFDEIRDESELTKIETVLQEDGEPTFGTPPDGETPYDAAMEKIQDKLEGFDDGTSEDPVIERLDRIAAFLEEIADYTFDLRDFALGDDSGEPLP